jgi:Flp pilus assembly protein TadG
MEQPTSTRWKVFFLRRQLKQLRREDKGQALVLTAVALVVLMLMAGLGVDVGYLRYEKQQMQKAADAGAIAGASALLYGGAVTAAARTDVAANGFTNGVNAIAVAVNNPPASGPHTGDSNYVEVIVSQPRPAFFMKVGGVASVPVRSRAVASAVANASGCIYCLDPSDPGTFVVKGTASITSACGIRINSNSPSAFQKTGSGDITVAQGSFGVVGGSSIVGSGTISPAPTAIPPFSDPLSDLPAPTPEACTPQSGNISGSGTTNLTEGTFCGGIKISGSGPVNFGPGTYILLGGGFTVTGSSVLTGTGVTFYNTGNATYRYAPVSIAGSAGTILSAPTSGPLAGILFFQDPSVGTCCGPTTVNSFDGSSGAIYQGALYFPTSPLSYTGSTSLSAYSILVGWQITMVGTTSINNDYSSLSGGDPIHSAALAE